MKSLPFAIALILLALPARAADVPCMSDGDCQEGQTCMFVPCAVPACPPNSDCGEPADCPTEGYCDTTPSDGTCTADADCPSGFTCDDVEVPCASGGCAPCTCACPAEGECLPCECPACDASTTCTPTTRKVCEYHPVDCVTDGDCKVGWACKTDEICSGTACACPGCAEGEECPPCDCGPAEEPVCQTTGSSCQPKEMTCVTGQDCPEGFECIQQTTGGDCMCPACECAPDTPDCGCTPCDCGQPTTRQVCLPSGWAEAGYSDSSLPTAGGTPREDDIGTTTPTGEGDVTTPPATPGGTAAEKAAASTGGEGCTSTPGSGTPSGLLLVGLIGLFAGLRVRRSRA